MAKKRPCGAGGWIRVTGGPGGEALLLTAAEKTALYDCGMGCFSKQLIENIKRELKGRPLDYLLLSHTHYDHLGAMPYLRKEFPEMKSVCSAYGQYVLTRKSALDVIRSMSEAADADYKHLGADLQPYDDADLSVDIVVKEGDKLDLGGQTVVVYETPGHTKCSIAFYIPETGVLLSSESTGVGTPADGISVPFLTGYKDTMDSIEKCRKIGAKYIYSTHYLQIPDEDTDRYWDAAIEYAESYKNFLVDRMKSGLSDEEVLMACKERNWVDSVQDEQPWPAFKANTVAQINLIRREFADELAN